MSTVEVDPKKSPQDSTALLTDDERAAAQKLGANPLDLLATQESRTYIEGIVETLIPTQKALESLAARVAQPAGTFFIIPDDLTANTSEYVYTHPVSGLKYLYCNGAAVSQTTYADLYAVFGASRYAADSGGNFTLPDCRGRELVYAGTHADCDVGDTFGPGTESSRRGTKHGHASTNLTVTGAPAVGTLAINAASASHTHTVTTSPELVDSGAVNVADHTVYTTSGPSGTTTSVTGAPGLGTLDVGGTAGLDTNEGGAGIVIGSLVVRF